MQIDWIIYRTEQNEKGTISQNLVANKAGEFQCLNYNLELPYKSNACYVSCIPSGIYRFEKRNHQTKGKIIMLSGVVNRSGILVHVGNVLRDTEGCILPCAHYGINRAGSQFFGVDSLVALQKLCEYLPTSGYVHIVTQA